MFDKCSIDSPVAPWHLRIRNNLKLMKRQLNFLYKLKFLALGSNGRPRAKTMRCNSSKHLRINRNHSATITMLCLAVRWMKIQELQYQIDHKDFDLHEIISRRIKVLRTLLIYADVEPRKVMMWNMMERTANKNLLASSFPKIYQR